MRLLLAAFAVLLCCPAAAAATYWAEPPFQPLSRDRAATCLGAVGADRVAVVGRDSGERHTVELLRVAPDRALVPDGGVPYGVSVDCPGVAAAASGAAVVAAQTFTDRGDTFGVAVRDAGGGFGPRRRIAVPRRTFITDIAAAIAPGGAAVVVWRESRGNADRLRYVRRVAGGAFGLPHTLRDRVDPFTDPVVGIDDAGRATVAYARKVRRRAVLEVATAPGAALGAPQRLTRAGFVTWLSLAVAADGGALLGYDDLSGVRMFERVPGAALMTPGPAYSGPPTRVRPVVALAPGGGAILAWLRQGAGAEEFDTSVEVALRVPGGAFGPPQRLSARAPGAASWSAFGPLPRFEAIQTAGALKAAVGADGATVVGWLEPGRPTASGWPPEP